MMNEVDRYISEAADFAQPILIHLRAIVHEACPDVTETMKWSAPCFMYKKSNLCFIAAFKKHCSFTFWLGSHIVDTHSILTTGEGMGHLGKITTFDDLPSDSILIQYLHQAMILAEQGIKFKRTSESIGREPEKIPDDFLQVLYESAPVVLNWERFSISARNDYINWINEAKTTQTREKRIETAAEWISEGKRRDWKYQK